MKPPVPEHDRLPPFGFSPQRRLRHSREFRKVFDHRQSVSDATLILYGQPNGRKFGRLGLSVSKKVGNAVIRNRWKRRIREGFRRQPDAVAGWDWVAIPRRGATCNARQIAKSLLTLTSRLRKLQRRRRS